MQEEQVKIFESPEFGQIRTAGTSEEPLFCLSDVAKALDYSNFAKAFLSADIPFLSTDTSARILAIVYVYGGDKESMTHNVKLKADLEYIQKKHGIEGGETPDEKISVLIKKYVSEFESKEKAPQWAKEMFNEKYGIEL